MLLVITTPSVQVSTTERSTATLALASSASHPITQLTTAMHRGDEDAYRQFFDAYFHRLLAYLLVVTHGNEELSRDLLQQTMIKVAKHIKPFTDEDGFWRWLTLLARTAAFDHSRKSKRYFGFLQRFWQSRPLEPEPHQSENAFEETALAQLQHLEAEDRLILEQKYISELSVKAIASTLNLSEKAVESRLTRARAKLKQLTLNQLRHE